ncbi:MAG: hypothetical protein ATN35_02010 [Epulopiscium sp. Nele67-Bin004]|nr:MAG: hypothetical protein ATN35_02010 [Epulopiscium sp. Nele67-Bin004]
MIKTTKIINIEGREIILSRCTIADLMLVSNLQLNILDYFSDDMDISAVTIQCIDYMNQFALKYTNLKQFEFECLDVVSVWELFNSWLAFNGISVEWVKKTLLAFLPLGLRVLNISPQVESSQPEKQYSQKIPT